jgi:endo-alpha-1,4-polygalactosaminidase (GH114 family)
MKQALEASLSPDCFRLYHELPDGAPHISSEWNLGYLARAKATGLKVFTVEYTLNPDKVAWVFETSQSYGFVPFANNPALDLFVAPRW